MLRKTIKKLSVSPKTLKLERRKKRAKVTRHLMHQHLLVVDHLEAHRLGLPPVERQGGHRQAHPAVVNQGDHRQAHLAVAHQEGRRQAHPAVAHQVDLQVLMILML
jgi:hypothetical protein